MASPFPGMDPYLEAHWGDVHTRLTTYASDQLAGQLPGDLVVRIQEYVNVEIESLGQQRLIGPDVRVIERQGSELSAAATAVAEQTADDADPLVVPLPLEEPLLHEIQIIDRGSGNRVVTVIEFLSVANHRSGQAAYSHKQRQLIGGAVNLVEIDLIRGGAWIIAAPPESVPLTRRGPYRICVVPAGRRREALLYRASYRFPLPEVRVPLRVHDVPITLALQPLVDQVYRNGGYDTIDYSHDPIPPLPPEDQAWADELLRRAGRR